MQQSISVHCLKSFPAVRCILTSPYGSAVEDCLPDATEQVASSAWLHGFGSAGEDFWWCDWIWFSKSWELRSRESPNQPTSLGPRDHSLSVWLPRVEACDMSLLAVDLEAGVKVGCHPHSWLHGALQQKRLGSFVLSKKHLLSRQT